MVECSKHGRQLGGASNFQKYFKQGVEWEFTVDQLSDPGTAPYDKTIGTDLLVELAADLVFCNQTIL